MTLEVRDLTFSYGDTPVLDGISMEVGDGVTAILGPNGAGKSTFVKCLVGVHRPKSGTVTFDGADLLAQADDGPRLAYLAQDLPRITGTTVIEVMLLGRVRTLSISVTEEDIDACYRALEMMGIEDLASRDMSQLSGGQCQMVMIAQCLVDEPQVMLLDEPMNNLDLRRELEMFETVCGITREAGTTTLMVLHDVNFAGRYADRIAVIAGGRLHSLGTPSEVITEDMLRDVYGVEAEVGTDRRGRPSVDPVRSIARRV